eukprot:s1443_g11.t5
MLDCVSILVLRWALARLRVRICRKEKILVDIGFFATALYAFARVGDLPRAERCVSIMRDARIVPDLASYNSLIHAASKAGQLHRVEHWLDQAEMSGLPMTGVCYASVLNACAKVADAEGAEAADSLWSMAVSAKWREQWIEAVSQIRSDLGYEKRAMAAFLVLTFRSSPLWATRSTSNATGAEQLRALQKTGLLRLTDLKNDPAKFFEAHRLLAHHAPKLGPGFWIRFTVHYNLFAGSVLAVGNDQQVAQLDDIQQKAGATALQQDASKEFVITSSDVGAHKNWISQGLVGELAVVVADLHVAGKRCGAHAFLMQLRKEGQPDMGRKTVGNDLDNAWIAFHGARIPHSALLNRYGDVQPGNGGTYISKAKGLTNMGMIGQRLFSGRVAVAWAALTFTRKLYEMTRQYSDRKKCWAPKGTSNLTSVPQLNHLYARADSNLAQLESFVGECERQLNDCLRKDEIPSVALQEAIACAKIVASETSIDLCFRLKQDVGSHALMGDTGFEQMDFLQDPDSKAWQVTVVNARAC